MEGPSGNVARRWGTAIKGTLPLCAQLRGECGARQVAGARVGIAENGGGFLGVEEGATTVTIVEKVKA